MNESAEEEFLKEFEVEKTERNNFEKKNLQIPLL